MTATMLDTQKAQDPAMKFRKILGRMYLNEARLPEAVEIFLGILRDDPEEVDTLLELGNLYLASGDGGTAAKLFRRVLELDPERLVLQKQIELAAREQEASGLPEMPVPTSPEAVARMLQRLTGAPEPVSDEEILQAYEMLQAILRSPQPGKEVAERLDGITNLLPALLELNIRQARADGKPEVAQALQNLQINIALQKANGGQKSAARAEPNREGAQKKHLRRRFRGTAWLLAPPGGERSRRMQFAERGLLQAGCRAVWSSALPDDSSPDVLIASSVYREPELVGALEECKQHGIPILLDHDLDFEQLPVFHPDYAAIGPGCMANSAAFTRSMELADQITTPSKALAESLVSGGRQARYVPEGWLRESGAAEREARTGSIWLGWVGAGKLIEDLAMIRRLVIRVLYEFENVHIAVAGSTAAYGLLESIPAERKKYIDDAGAAMRAFDILLVPLHAHPFNNTQSDRLLMEAGIEGIPWIASPAPAFADWKTGGLVADTRDKWHTYLRQLVLDPKLRQNFGRAGSEAAAKREVQYSGHSWVEAIEEVLRGKSADDGTWKRTEW